ncbi:MAG: NAD+ synthase [Thermoplasmataceae archaeon]
MNSAVSAEAVQKIVKFIRSYVSKKQAILGVSGGIDSALVLKLLSLSLDKERVKAFYLPDGIYGTADAIDVEKISSATGIPVQTVDIHEIVSAFSHTLKISDRRALGNIKSRIRMSVLYYQANIHDGLVVGTTNKSEFYTGYFTKYGDGGCDLEPILHLSKSEVRDLSAYLEIPPSILSKSPSAGLWEGQTDESELGLKYRDIDNAIENLINRRKMPSNEEEARVSELIRASEHKRRLPESML